MPLITQTGYYRGIVAPFFFCNYSCHFIPQPCIVLRIGLVWIARFAHDFLLASRPHCCLISVVALPSSKQHIDLKRTLFL